MKSKHSSGEGLIIAEYVNGDWREDESQPKGAWTVAVDSHGMPAFTAHTASRHIFHKQVSSGKWREIKVCAHYLAFGRNDVLYIMGCDGYVYLRRQPGDKVNKWVKIYNRKATHMSASKDALWIIDWDTRMPFKFDGKTKQFHQKGDKKAFWISAGVNGHAVITGNNDDEVYGWHEAENTWKSLGSSKVNVIAVGR